MNIRQAILLAADHIERHPEQYQFAFCRLINGQGCMMTWVTHFMGYAHNSNAQDLSIEVWGVDTNEWLRRTGGIFEGRRVLNRCDPMDSAKILRIYADRYHPVTEAKPAQPAPDWNAIMTKLGKEPVRAGNPMERA